MGWLRRLLKSMSEAHFGLPFNTEPHIAVNPLDPEQGGTRLKYKFILITSGLMRLMEPVIASSIKKDTETDFETLKRVLEN